MTTICHAITYLGLLSSTAIALAADDNRSVHTGPPHKVLIGDYSTTTLALVDQKGEIEWQTPIRNIHDAAVLPNGNILFQTDWTEILEMSPERKIVWKYDAKQQNATDGQRVEIHAFQRLPNGHTMLAESGRARIIEVDHEGKIRKEIPLKVEHPNAHTDTRLARKLENGHYLVAHEGDNKIVREYDGDGKVVWEYPTHTKVYSAIRLKNGNTLIGTGDGHRVLEVHPNHQIVWSVEEKELPGISLAWITMVERLPNGNTLIVNCHGGDQNPQLIEVDSNKKITWTFKDFRRFGNSLPVARIVE
ncbi:beta-propeller domain-containing protein [Schlesneria paludicola]|uniref:beta-propeller domain-containing protein n=1 Tax=Schlesneria paludicola TaxID=360056 RepID=UPI000299F209|nr:PQQ-binding-like beta-propeller repeat protein [Schlesneria paludicola]